MTRAVPNRQRNLFEIEDPPPALPPERRAKLLPLLRALLLEAQINGAVMVQGGDDDQDHA